MPGSSIAEPRWDSTGSLRRTPTTATLGYEYLEVVIEEARRHAAIVQVAETVVTEGPNCNQVSDPGVASVTQRTHAVPHGLSRFPPTRILL